jgi:hypothetical protein
MPLTKKVKIMKKILTLISLCLLALSSTAFADGDNYTAANGTGCDNYYAGDTAQFDHQYDGIRNISASAHWVTCPVDKDSVGSGGSVGNLSGLGTTWVHWAGVGTMYCDLNNFDVNGNRTAAQTGSGGGPGWFSIPPLGGDDFYGTNTMRCLVPAGATLQTYHVFEN